MEEDIQNPLDRRVLIANALMAAFVIGAFAGVFILVASLVSFAAGLGAGLIALSLASCYVGYLLGQE